MAENMTIECYDESTCSSPASRDRVKQRTWWSCGVVTKVYARDHVKAGRFAEIAHRRACRKQPQGGA
jgi:hypothetical protein